MKKRKKRPLAVLFTLLFILVGVLSAHAEEIAIITHKRVPPEIVDAETVKKIYSGRMRTWPDNRAIIVTIIDNADFHGEFLKKYVKKSEFQFINTWKKLVFSGKGTYPRKFEDMASLVDYVAKTEGAIGYVNKTGLSGVNVLKP